MKNTLDPGRFSCSHRKGLRQGPAHLMDRGIPTEEVLAAERPADDYLVGTPRSWLDKFEQSLLQKQWQNLRAGIDVKLIREGGETYVLAVAVCTKKRVCVCAVCADCLTQEAATRRYQRTILIKLGEAKKEAGPRIWRLLDIAVPPRMAPPMAAGELPVELEELPQAYRREGRYPQHPQCRQSAPPLALYIQLTEIEPEK